jgi:hypothetical protein
MRSESLAPFDLSFVLIIAGNELEFSMRPRKGRVRFGEK